MKLTSKINSVLAVVFLAISVLVVATGFFISPHPIESLWWSDFTKALCYWTLISTTYFLVVRQFFKPNAHLLAALGITGYLTFATSITNLITVISLTLSIYTLGKMITRWITPNKEGSLCTHFLIGASIYILVIEWVIQIPVTYQWSAILFICAPSILSLLIKQPLLDKNEKEQLYQFSSYLSGLNYPLWCTVLCWAGFVGSITLIPSVMSDDNTYHLSMWSQLTANHKYLFDVETQVWSAAPYTLDAIHGIVSVAANADCRSTLNLAYMFVLLTMIYLLSKQICNNSNYALISVLLFSSTPMLGNLLLGLQTELALAMLTAIATYIILNNQQPSIHRVGSFILILSILISIKLPAAILAIALLITFLLVRFFDLKNLQKNDSIFIIIIICVASCIAFTPYWTAYHITGNPVFPLYNAIFKSPYYLEQNFSDETYKKGASLLAYWNCFFNTSKYFEAFNFSAGFQYLTLPFFGALILALKRRNGLLITLALPCFTFGFIMFYMMQYWRYLFPIAPLAHLLAMSLFTNCNGYNTRLLSAIKAGALIFFIIINVYFYPAISWLFTKNHLLLANNERSHQFATSINPEIELNRYMNTFYPGKNVLFEITRPASATLQAKPFHPVWFSPATLKAFDKMHSPEDLLNYMREKDIEFVYWQEAPEPKSFEFRKFIEDVIKNKGTKLTSAENISLYKIDLK